MNSSQNEKKDMLKNFKKWSLSTANILNNSSVQESYINLPNKNCSQTKLTNKWFDEIEKIREIKYEYDENTVIKCESEYEDVDMINLN